MNERRNVVEKVWKYVRIWRNENKANVVIYNNVMNEEMKM
jgi:hypothetical protein